MSYFGGSYTHTAEVYNTSTRGSEELWILDRCCQFQESGLAGKLRSRNQNLVLLGVLETRSPRADVPGCLLRRSKKYILRSTQCLGIDVHRPWDCILCCSKCAFRTRKSKVRRDSIYSVGFRNCPYESATYRCLDLYTKDDFVLYKRDLYNFLWLGAYFGIGVCWNRKRNRQEETRNLGVTNALREFLHLG